jgi:hypothetical protein
VDQQLSEAHSLSVRGNISGNLLDGFRSSAQSVPTHAGEQKGSSAGGLVSMSSVVGQFLNEFKGSYGLDTRGANPYLRLPEGRVLVGSRLSNGQVAFSGLDFGGNGALPNDNASNQLELTNSCRGSRAGKHRWKLGGLINRSGSAHHGRPTARQLQFLSLAASTRSAEPVQPIVRAGAAHRRCRHHGRLSRRHLAAEPRFPMTYGVRSREA